MVLKVFGKEEDFENEFVMEIMDRAEEEGYEVERLDTDKDESHTQSELYQVFTTPSFVVAGNDGREVEAWRGTIPAVGDLMEFLNS